MARLPPAVLDGLLVVPIRLFCAMGGNADAQNQATVDTKAAAGRSQKLVMEVERDLGFLPKDREFEKFGDDIESAIPETGRLRFMQVKGRLAGADIITVTRKRMLRSFNKPDDVILAMVAFREDGGHDVGYLSRPPHRKGITTKFSGATVNFSYTQLLAEGVAPS